jgi:hypothetical protein
MIITCISEQKGDDTMSLSRWENLKQWVVSKSKSRPAQICLSIAAGGGLASGLFWLGDRFISILPSGGFAEFLQVTLYILTTLTFVGTTALKASDWAVSLNVTDQLTETVNRLAINDAVLKKLIKSQGQNIAYLLKSDKTHHRKNLDRDAASQQFLGVADIFLKHIPNADDRALCEKILKPLRDHMSPADLRAHLRMEPYFNTDIDEEYALEEGYSEPSSGSQSIELKTMNPKQTGYGSFYQSLPRRQPAHSLLEDDDLDLENPLHLSAPSSDHLLP